MKFNTLQFYRASSKNRDISYSRNMAIDFSRNLILTKFSENKVHVKGKEGKVCLYRQAKFENYLKFNV